MKKYLDFQKMYDNGIDYLYVGGRIINNEFYREKDVLEDDYSVPTITDGFEIIKQEVDEYGMYHLIGNDFGMILSEDEVKAGIKDI